MKSGCPRLVRRGRLFARRRRHHEDTKNTKTHEAEREERAGSYGIADFKFEIFEISVIAEGNQEVKA